MNRVTLFFLSLLLALSSVCTAYAAELPVQEENALTKSIVPEAPKIPSPVNIERKNIDGNEYIIKTFETAADFDPELLIEDGFEDGGFLFAHISTEKNENVQEMTQEASETVTVETPSKSMEEILKRLPSTKTYDQDGYTGTLALDNGSIVTEVAGYTSKTSTITASQSIPGLMYPDPSYVPQTTQKDGHTLSLSNVNWNVTGTGLAGDTLVPTEYTAVASYSKSVTSNVPTGYITTAEYRGTVSKTETGTMQYIITYIGTPIYVEVIADPLVEEGFRFPWGILVGVLGLLALIGLGVFLFLWLQSKKGVNIYNLIDKEYICVGRQRMDYQKPVIDLNHFKDVMQSNDFSFVMDKTTTKKLYGRNVAITLEDVTMMHLIKGYNEEYRFNLNLGGMLDVT